MVVGLTQSIAHYYYLLRDTDNWSGEIKCPHPMWPDGCYYRGVCENRLGLRY